MLLAITAYCLGTYVYVGRTMPTLQSGEGSLAPIVVRANGALISIGVDEISKYHGRLEGEDPHFCPCCACMYRVLSAGIQEVWGNEVPEQSDIVIQSRLVSNGALHTAWYVTGTGPGMGPDPSSQVILVAPNGSVLTEYSEQARNMIAKKRSYEDYQFVITRLSTGESANLTVRRDVFSEDFFEMRKRVKIDKNATEDETAEFESEWDALLESFMEKSDSELFTIIKTDKDGDLNGQAAEPCTTLVRCVEWMKYSGKQDTLSSFLYGF